jgi:hypothetical protein
LERIRDEIMAEHLQADRAWAAAALARAAGVPITYTRGGHSVTLTAVPTAGQSGIAVEQRFQLAWEGMDWLLTAADLVLDGAVVLPEPGDRIRRLMAVYEVMAPAVGEQCFVYRDQPFNTLLRIHAKRVQ